MKSNFKQSCAHSQGFLDRRPYRARVLLSAPSGRPFVVLTVSQCRRLLNDPALSERDVEKIRETLYGFADMLTDRYIKEHPQLRSSSGAHHDN